MLVSDGMAFFLRARTHHTRVALRLAGYELLTIRPYTCLLSMPALCQFLGSWFS